MTLGQRLALYARLIRLDKPIGTLLLLWPTLWALWLSASGNPDAKIVLVFVVGTLLMRSAGCAINDYADRNIDPYVARTRNRPLASGEISKTEALLLAAGLSVIAFLLVLRLNTLTAQLSVAALFVAASYPFSKRFFALPQAYLGVAFGFGIPMAYAAQTGSVPLPAWILLAANIFWAIAYDTEYAMVDRDDDHQVGIHTSAILFGRLDVTAVMASYALMLLLLLAVGAAQHAGLAYYAGILVACGLMAYHYTLIKDRTREGCFKAFLNNTWVGAAIFAGIVADYLTH